MSEAYPKRKRRDTEYSKAVAEAERGSRFFVATELKATIPEYRRKLDKGIAELRIAWRDMLAEEKQPLIAETICKAKNFTRPILQQPEKSPGHSIHIDPANRDRQVEALYLLFTPEQREAWDRGERGAR